LAQEQITTCFRCGDEIHFDPAIKGFTGKCIPLGSDNKPHRCGVFIGEKKKIHGRPDR
jgi:hypothetical protein